MINTIIGKKTDQMQAFLEDGTRIPVTKISFDSIVIIDNKTVEKDGYTAVRLGVGSIKNKKITKPKRGLTQKIKKDYYPELIRELRVENDAELPGVGTEVNVSEILEPGDIVSVTGKSKGKGFAGVVKRHNFRGGPRTHGQSDRERAPGSIGQSTTPGRVYKGKRMAGRMGQDKVTVSNLIVVSVDKNEVLVKGLVPGVKNSFISISKKGHKKDFIGLFGSKKADEVVPTQDVQEIEEIKPDVEVKNTEEVVNKEDVKSDKSELKVSEDTKEENGKN